MSYSCFTDKLDAPTEKDIYKILGSHKSAWQEISEYLTADKKATAKYKYYGINYGWALGFSKSCKSIISLYPTVNDFCIQVILNKKQEVAVLHELPNATLHDIIEKKEPIHEGKWIFAQFSVFMNVDEIKHVIDIRMDKRYK
jgi:hypothetical protein